MARNVTRKLVDAHLVDGDPVPGEEVALRIDHTLTQDATGTLVMLELEAMGLDRVRTDVSVQYVDHNLLQTDERNADDHRFLQSACRRFGLWYSGPGNGISHVVHMQRFGRPGATMLGSDSHTPAAGAIGMLAIGVGGLEVALAMAGEPLHVRMPEIWGIHLVGALPPWVSAKDVILELLRRHGVKGGVGRVLEFHGPGLDRLTTWDRHVIANMGAELGATTTVFPADAEVRRFLRAEGREDDFSELVADAGAGYDLTDEVDLSALEPLIATPSSPGNVVPVAEVAGAEIGQVVVGSSANPGLRDFGVVARIVDGRRSAPGVSFDVNPTSRALLENLAELDLLMPLVRAGARLHQSGCMGCIGMGQAPASDTNSLRTFPRNFPGRSGTREDRVYLCSPETAAASALTGRITDPRELEGMGVAPPEWSEPDRYVVDTDMLEPPPDPQTAAGVTLRKSPNISDLPDFDPLPDDLSLPVLLVVGDNVSTDEIMPAGQRVLPFRSNIPRISDFVYWQVDEDYPQRAREAGDHAIVGGENYGQGSSREHAAIAPRYLGLRAVLAKGFARIHWQNLVNFGIVPLEFADADDYQRLEAGDTVEFRGLRAALERGESELTAEIAGKGPVRLTHRLSPRQVAMVARGSLISIFKERLSDGEAAGARP